MINVGVRTLPTSDKGDLAQYFSGSSQGMRSNQYPAIVAPMSVVSAVEAQLITGRLTEAAAKRDVLPMAHDDNTPPPEPPPDTNETADAGATTESRDTALPAEDGNQIIAAAAESAATSSG